MKNTSFSWVFFWGGGGLWAFRDTSNRPEVIVIFMKLITGLCPDLITFN